VATAVDFVTIHITTGRTRLKTGVKSHSLRGREAGKCEGRKSRAERNPELVALVRQLIGQRCFVEPNTSGRDDETGWPVIHQRETPNSFSMSAIMGCVKPALRNSAKFSAMTCSHNLLCGVPFVGKVKRFSLFSAFHEHECVRPVGFD
jgi:hypothetical protein